MPRELTLAVVGIDFANRDKAKTNRRSEMMLLAPGVPVTLVPEPKNPADPHAVAVISPSGIQLGYLSAERSPWIGSRLRGGDEVTAIFQGMTGTAGFVRVRIGGGEPSLPPGAPVADAPAASGEGDWMPDEEGPEWGA